MAEVEHTVAVTAYFERDRDDYLLKAPTTYAVIEVKPPIDPGDEFTFKRAVLGHEWCLVDLRKLFATGTAIVFMAESSIPDQDQRHEDIAVMARRIGQLANNPKTVLAMMEDKPFPEQPKPEPKLELVKELPPEEGDLSAEAPSVKDGISAEVAPEDERAPADVLSEEEQSAGFTLHLAPVDIPSLEVNIPPIPNFEDINVKPPEDLPPVEIPTAVGGEEQERSSVFGPIAARLTSFAPQAPALPWPPSTSEGRHASKDQTEN